MDHQIIKPHRALTQPIVLLQRGQCLMHRLDQAVIDRNGDIATEQSRRAGIRIAPRCCMEAIHLDRAGIQRGDGVDIFFEFAKVNVKRLLAQPPILALTEDAEGTVGQRQLVALCIMHGREGHINPLQKIKRLRWRPRRIGEICQQLLASLVQNVVSGAENILENVAVGCKAIL